MIRQVIAHEWTSHLQSSVILEIVPFAHDISRPRSEISEKFVRSTNRLRVTIEGKSPHTTPVLVDAYCADVLPVLIPLNSSASGVDGRSAATPDGYVSLNSITGAHKSPRKHSASWRFLRTISLVEPLHPEDCVSNQQALDKSENTRTNLQTEATIEVTPSARYLKFDLKGILQSAEDIDRSVAVFQNTMLSTLSTPPRNRTPSKQSTTTQDRHIVSVNIEPIGASQASIRGMIAARQFPRADTFRQRSHEVDDGPFPNSQPPLPLPQTRQWDAESSLTPRKQETAEAQPAHREAEDILHLRKVIHEQSKAIEALLGEARAKEHEHDAFLSQTRSELEREFHEHLVFRERYFENQRRMLKALKAAGY